MNTQTVMFSVALSFLPIAGHPLIPHLAQVPASDALEPAASLNASIVLESTTETGSQLTGRLRVSLTSLTSDVSISLDSTEGKRLARLELRKGERRVMRFFVDLRAGEDNDLGFRLVARRADGTVESQRLHLSVPLDPDRLPQVMPDSLQYQGSVEPDGGSR